MHPFIAVFLTIVGFIAIAELYLILNAREGWEDEFGFHEGRNPKIDFIRHGEGN